MHEKLWGDLRCNYGYTNASHVPESVHKLFESNWGFQRNKAYWKLDNYVITQGYIDESAPYALDLMYVYWAKRFPKKINSHVWELLYELAHGYSDYDVRIGPYSGQSVEKATKERLGQFIPDIRKFEKSGSRNHQRQVSEIIQAYEG